MNIFQKINQLPNEIINHEMFKYLNDEQLLFTNKKYYEKNIIKYRLKNEKFSYKKSGLLDNYIKKIIINHYNYIFSLLIQEKYTHWIKIKRYKYKSYKYKSYIDLLDQLCIDLQSTKCRNYLLSYEKDNGFLRKNKYKKMRRINNIWSN
jgi:hypothetical protein